MTKNLIERGYKVSMRFMYEMNGGWFPHGVKPEEFKTAFRTVSSTIRSSLSADQIQDFVMFWSPNAYLRDRYLDYWPGDEHVEWAGLDAYFKGLGDPTPGYAEQAIWEGDFYQTFCVEKGKVCGFGETGIDDGRGDNYQVKTKWIDQVYNKALLEKYPKWRVIVWFEYKKFEDGMDRDWYIALGGEKNRAVSDYFKNAMNGLTGI
jgi:beta-mannanase